MLFGTRTEIVLELCPKQPYELSPQVRRTP